MLVSQLFIGLVFCLGILLALGRGERLSLTATLSRSQAVTESQAEVLSAIIDTMHDGLTVIDETGQVLRRNPAGAEMVRTEPDRLNNLRDSAFTIMTTDGRVMAPADYPWARAIAGENVVEPATSSSSSTTALRAAPWRSVLADCRRSDARGMRPGRGHLPRRHHRPGPAHARWSPSPVSWRTTCAAR